MWFKAHISHLKLEIKFVEANVLEVCLNSFASTHLLNDKR